MKTLSLIPTEQIRHRDDARSRSDESLSALADSIGQIGLLQPIRVRPIADGYEVIAGSHRLQACELLGHTEIACIISDDDELRAELSMIDENLVRAELSPTERARQTSRRKELYEELHPEVKHGSPGVSRQVGDTRDRADFDRFSADTAAASGRSERSIQRDAERGEKLSPETLDLVQGTPLDRGNYLDRLKGVPRAEQSDRVRADLASGRPAGRIAGQYVSTTCTTSADHALFRRFLATADWLVAIDIPALIASSGRKRAELGHRAASAADRLNSVVERIAP